MTGPSSGWWLRMMVSQLPSGASRPASSPATWPRHVSCALHQLRAKFEIGVHQLAGDHCIQAWDDEGFADHIESLTIKRARLQLRAK